ncbi:unnamed protein product [Cyprideis torosa]|uniref:Uncharacterized protein n=1 Tax=Cyprideis torosa TaxID=163714 RepID=A0A7R8ZR18_9CRUS|nr:unnamed protein product [Cyprideis torosa]CAG0891981.1 unnamed protein product [Cyprideis torosa]
MNQLAVPGSWTRTGGMSVSSPTSLQGIGGPSVSRHTGPFENRSPEFEGPSPALRKELARHIRRLFSPEADDVEVLEDAALELEHPQKQEKEDPESIVAGCVVDTSVEARHDSTGHGRWPVTVNRKKIPTKCSRWSSVMVRQGLPFPSKGGLDLGYDRSEISLERGGLDTGCIYIRDIINYIHALLTMGGSGLFFYRGIHPLPHMIVSWITGLLCLFGAIRTDMARCDPDDIFIIVGSSFALGFFGAHFIHYDGVLWYPEAYMTAISAFQVCRIVIKSLGLLSEDL